MPDRPQTQIALLQTESVFEWANDAWQDFIRLGGDIWPGTLGDRGQSGQAFAKIGPRVVDAGD
jgi:hypothetical protein